MPVCTNAQLPTGDDTVITGIGGCLPESENVYQFQDSVFNKVYMMTEDDQHLKLGKFMCCCLRLECPLCGFICLWFV